MFSFKIKGSPSAKQVVFWKCFFGSFVFLSTLFHFWPTLGYSFLNWDDGARVVENMDIRRINTDSIAAMFSSFCVSNYTPLERISCALDYQIWGLNPMGYHLTNVLLHGINAVWIFLLAWQLMIMSSGEKRIQDASSMFLRMTACCLAAFVFALHPLRVESVAWISERRDVLSLFWLAPCVWCYVKSKQIASKNIQRRVFFGSLTFFALSLLSKATGVTIPIVLLMLDFFPLRRLELKKTEIPAILRCIFEKLPYFGMSLVIGLIAIWGQKDHDAMIGMDSYPLAFRIISAFSVFAFYLQKWIFPWDLCPLYPSAMQHINGLEMEITASILWFILISIYSIWMIKRRPTITVAWWSFVIMILPFTGLLQAGNQMAADRYTYLSMIPFAFLVGAGFEWLWTQKFPRMIRVICTVLIGAGLSGWSWIAMQQMAIWKNSRVLWEYVLTQSPQEHLALNNYSTILIQEKNFHLAQVMAREATVQRPGWDMAWHNYGVALSLCKRRNASILAFERSLKLNPRSGDTHFALANLLFLKGEYPAARYHYFMAVQDMPSWEHLTNLGISLRHEHQFDFAVKYLSRAAMGGYPPAYLVWASVFLDQQHLAQATALLAMGYQHTHDPEILKAWQHLTGKNGITPDQDHPY